jgi:acyl-CoA thioester hydrolase
MPPFRYTVTVRWAELDSNGHMRNSAYLDLASHVRMTYFAAHGFPAEEFARRRFGPVVRRDELSFRRELRLLDEIDVTFEIEAMSRDGSRFRIVNRFLRGGAEVARVTSTGGWLDLDRRRLTAPPDELVTVLRQLVGDEAVVDLDDPPGAG